MFSCIPISVAIVFVASTNILLQLSNMDTTILIRLLMNRTSAAYGSGTTRLSRPTDLNCVYVCCQYLPTIFGRKEVD